MNKRECPSCAMEVDVSDDTGLCPICGYEFPVGQKSYVKITALALAALAIIPIWKMLTAMLNHFFPGGVF
jgi:uncharacterized paraquat-inducible protein A